MKKNGISGILAILVILVLLISSVSLVSAGWFEGIWNKITGGVTEENITTIAPELVPEEIPCPPIPTSMWCPDCDIEKYGNRCLCPQTTDESGCAIWDCNACGPILESEPIPERKIIICCKTWPVIPNPTYSYTWKAENECPPLQDGLPPVGEGYAIVSNEYCEEKPRPPEPEPVPEVPPTEVVRICAAKIKINFDKKIYYFGEGIKLVVEIFDSQGTHLSNYPFEGEMYFDNRWHSAMRTKTDNDGYFIQKGIVGEEGPTTGKIIFRVFAEEIGSCKRVEESMEIELRKGEKEEVCGIGVCVPELAKEPEEIAKEKILYSCSGCELEGKCYPMGYRKEGKYCGINNEFIVQLEAEASCENSFECKSNVCISGECISESLMKRIINWFKKLFGGEEPESELEPEELELEKCSKLLIEKDIGNYEYGESGYGDSKEAQAPLYSEDGKQIGVVKCCRAQYLYEGRHGGMALICPFDSREDVTNSLKWLSARGEITSGEYKDEQVYKIGEPVIIWTHKDFVIAVGGGEGREPEMNVPLPEDAADAYLDEYPNDLEIVGIPELQPHVNVKPDEKFLKEIEKLGEVTLIDFETLTDGTILQNGDKLTGNEWESLGVTFEAPSEEYLKVFGPMYPFNPLDKLSLSPGFGPFESGSDTHDDLTIIFSEPVKAAGIYLLDLGGTDERESITFLDKNNNVLEKISPWPKSTFGNPAPGTFVYLVKDGISKIEILENTQDGDDIAYDNLYFVSEPAVFERGSTKTLGECEEMSDISEKEECYLDVAVLGAEDINICERITDNNLRESCYTGVGQVTKNLSVCEKVLDSYRKHDCYSNVAMQIEDVSVCEGVTETTYRNDCYAGVAHATRDGNLCTEKIADISRRENCYSNMGPYLNDGGWCEKIIVRLDLKDMCYLNFDPEDKTPELCEKIVDTERKERCYADIK